MENENIKTIFSAIRHPQSNTIERVNRELSQFFRVSIKNNHKNWANYLKIIQNHYKSNIPL